MKTNVMYKFRLLIILLGLMIVLSLISPRFLSLNNISNVFWAVSIIGIMASGSIYTIITGGIDLSVGSVAAFAGILFGSLFVWGDVGIIPSLCLTLIAGTLFGFLNGYVITKFNVPPFIATMASLSYVFGIAMVISSGATIGILQPKAFINIGLGKLLGIPVPVYIMLICMAGSYWLLNYSSFGRKIIAVGGNRVTAELSGINSKRIILMGYVISSFMATLSGIVLSSMTQQAKAAMAQGYQMDVITAIVLGGTNLAGGNGSIPGVLFGTLLVGFISNGLNLLNVPSAYHAVLQGVVILTAIALDSNLRNNVKIRFLKPSK